MKAVSRRNFLMMTLAAPLVSMARPIGKVMTVNGLISTERLGKTLIHEHVLVDFIGADQISEKRWDKTEVVNRMAPLIAEAKALGIKTMAECTPAFLGRDARLLKLLADRTGMQFITNTGYYGAMENKYLPPWAFTESAQQLAQRWADDFDYGIDGSNIRPGFIKISVDARPEGLSEIHKKLVAAAAITHRKTGMVIYSHTGPGKTALEQIDILKANNVAPSAFVWVHAQAEKDSSVHMRIAKAGAWVSLDNIVSDFDRYADLLTEAKQNNLLDKILISQDSGYYHPGEPDGGDINGYTIMLRELIPRLQQRKFSKKDVNRLLIRNPYEALVLMVRKY